MAITALAPWFGAKRNMADQIVRELGPHRVYWEPFCGSLAVLLNKPAATLETVNDLHGDLVNLARVIASDEHYRVLLRRLRHTLCVETLPAEAKERLYGDEPVRECVERAYWYFVESWLGRNGFAGTLSTNNGFCRRFTGNGSSSAKRLESAVCSIPAWHRRLRRVVILKSDAFHLIPRIEDAPRTAIYLDPPYITKGGRYLHDFAAADHQRLATELRRFTQSRVVVSYYAHPSLAELYPGWTVVEKYRTKSLANQGTRDRNGATVAPEVLLINGPSLAAVERN